MSLGMYSTKKHFPKAAEGYLNVGDPYDKGKAVENDRFKGKQFITNPPKKVVCQLQFGNLMIFSGTNCWLLWRHSLSA